MRLCEESNKGLEMNCGEVVRVMPDDLSDNDRRLNCLLQLGAALATWTIFCKSSNLCDTTCSSINKAVRYEDFDLFEKNSQDWPIFELIGMGD
ncbi:hypothetical protein KIN20_010283 [Parelaphostrongylus tenuis]|uniref:Uncharacterized protein n=1 Tax=Parelaphostrongylus tenuis TaxID=148309 RepID=A0AAD5QLR9_PARTN|nr:hypothetical protein KIN20_010283 [Parelaphostrongylus tenuis]